MAAAGVQLRGEVVAPVSWPATMAVEVVRGGVEAIAALAPEWRALCAEGPSTQPFAQPEWFTAYLRAFEPNARLLLLTARRGGALRAVLPLIEERVGGVGPLLLRAPVNEHSNRFDLIHGAGDGDEAVAAIWQALRRRAGWVMIDIRHVPPDGALRRLLSLAGEAGHPTFTRATLSSPYVLLREGEADLSRGFGHRHFQGDLRRRMRKLAAQGEVRLRRVTTADPIVLDRFYTLEASGWKGQAGTAIACDPVARRFYTELAEVAAARGHLVLFELWCGDRVIAMHYGMIIGDRYLELKSAYDETFKIYAPGHLLIRELLQTLIADGVVEFDMLGHVTDHKLRWTSFIRHHHHCFIFGAGPLGRALALGFARFLPTALRLRRRVRQWRGLAVGPGRAAALGGGTADVAGAEGGE